MNITQHWTTVHSRQGEKKVIYFPSTIIIFNQIKDRWLDALPPCWMCIILRRISFVKNLRPLKKDDQGHGLELLYHAQWYILFTAGLDSAIRTMWNRSQRQGSTLQYIFAKCHLMFVIWIYYDALWCLYVVLYN